MKLKKGQKLLMIGDSITDAGRSFPIGEGVGALGDGYVRLVNATLNSYYPELGIRVVNVGTSGHTVRDLAARWQTDVIEQKPDWVTIMIGTNDVWRQFDCPWQPEWHVNPEEYESTLDRLITETLPKVEGIMLATPFFIEPRKDDAMRARMDEYGQIVKKLASKHQLTVIDTQAAFDEVLNVWNSAALAWDRVHPNPIGVSVLARVFLEAFEFDPRHRPTAD